MTQTSAVEAELGSAYIAGCYLAHALNRAFLFSTGRTLTAAGNELLLTPTTGPVNWSTNARDLIGSEEWRMLQGEDFLSQSPRTLARLPVKESVVVLRALGRVSDVYDQMSFYHEVAVRTTEYDVHFLMFAQPLEIARELIPGRSGVDKHRRLPHVVRDRLGREVNWLLEISQQRRQTRHSIDKRVGLRLKPELTDEEEADYVHDAEFLIRALLCKHLRIPLACATDLGGVEHDQLTDR